MAREENQMSIIRSRLERLEEANGGIAQTVYVFGADTEKLEAKLEAARIEHPAARLMGFCWEIVRGGYDGTAAAT
jgi:hypothetical protein